MNTKRRAINQAQMTRSMYRAEETVLEKIPAMRCQRSLGFLQKLLDDVWDYGIKDYQRIRPKPQLRFGQGIWYHGRYLSYNIDTHNGQVIELCPGQRNISVLVHEIVHALGPIQHARRFSQVYQRLLDHYSISMHLDCDNGRRFRHYLKVDHPRLVRRVYQRA